MAGDRTIVTELYGSMRLPVIVAPMFLISGPDLVIAAAKAGVIAAFPVANARTLDDLKAWLDRISGELAQAGKPGQWAINMIVHPTYDRFDQEIELIAQYKPRIVITALGGPARALDKVHAFGGKVFTDVISVEHAKKAVDAGADGLVLVASGAGGHTGTYSPFAFVAEVRRFWDGPVVLGGAITNANAIRAALTLGADFAYMGTRFIPTPESLVSDAYREMLVKARINDIITTKAITGVPANWLKASLEQANFDFAQLDAPKKIDFSNISGDSKAWKNIWGAGQGVGSIDKIQTVAEVIDALVLEYQDQEKITQNLSRWPHQV